LSVMCHFGGQLLTLEQLQMPNAKVTHQIDWKKLMIFCACWFVIKTSVQWSCLSQTRCLFEICSWNCGFRNHWDQMLYFISD
jgi:hypothetical protein